jgi:glycosyltransferase involved in cell wall biosynthesis
MGVQISVLLPTYNCESTVRDTLESVQRASEIVVVDSFSTDRTLEICREYGCRILQHEYLNSATQKNWAAPQCAYSWIFQIDSDEAAGPGLWEEIEESVARADSQTHAFRIPRRNHFLGRWMQHGGFYPDYQIRLFRRNEGSWQTREVHAHLRVPGKIATLQSYLIHHDAPTISRRMCNLDRYTRYEADELVKNGARFRWHDLVLRPWAAFGYRYLYLQGFRDGWRGFVHCVYAAIYVFVSRAKLWELEELGMERSPRANDRVRYDRANANRASKA